MYAMYVAGCMSQYDVVQEISYMPGLDSNVEVVASYITTIELL